jgi:predicted NUDIX family NTP pyrophosphohydrolase
VPLSDDISTALQHASDLQIVKNRKPKKKLGRPKGSGKFNLVCSLRFNRENWSLLSKLKTKLNTTKANAVRIAIEQLAEKEGINVDNSE